MKLAIVTANFGGYDSYKPIIGCPEWDKFYFTDKPEKVRGWNVINLGKQENPQQKSREIKIKTHEYLKEYDYFCYIDASMSLFRTPKAENLRVIHPDRICIFQEGERIKELGKGNADEQIKRYKAENMPKNYGLYANGHFIRDRSWDEVHNEWWNEYLSGTNRDQITLPYVLWKNNIKIGDNCTAITWKEFEFRVNLYRHKL